jgi:PST family polysaccharide transporter
MSITPIELPISAPENPLSGALPLSHTADLSGHDRFLSTADLSVNLKRRSVRGAAMTAASQAVRFILRFGSTAILARLLTPRDYGLVAMAGVITGFAGMFKDAGLTNATVQRKDITQGQVSMLFWINLFLGCAIALTLVAIAPVVAAFYHEPRLIGITRALAVSFIFGGMTLQHQALLRRRMEFRMLAILEVASFFCGTVVAVGMAAFGCGYWSLVGMTVGTSAANAAGVWLALAWRPALPRRGSGAMPLVRFGRDLLVFDIVYFFSRQTDLFLLGRFWGPVPVAFYEKGYNLLMQPFTQINAPLGSVIELALARVQDDAPRLRRLFLHAMDVISGFSFPLVVCIALFAREVVLLMLGPAWLECVPLFRFLAPAAALSAISSPWGWLLIALGQTRKFRRVGVASAAVVVSSFIIGLPYGAKGVAICYSAAISLMTLPAWWYVTKETPVHFVDVFRTWIPPIVACVPAVMATFLVGQLSVFAIPHWLITVAGVVSFGAIYALVLLIGFKKWSLYREIIRELGLK